MEENLERETRLELATPDLGKVVLYQLSFIPRLIIVIQATVQQPENCDWRGVSFKFWSGNETRTRDPDLGKVVLYQLSYSRLIFGFRPASGEMKSFDQDGAFKFWSGKRLNFATPTLARSCSTN